MNKTYLLVCLFFLVLMPCTTLASFTIQSDKTDMSDSILHAIQLHDTTILDGSNGDFYVGHTIVLKHLKNKALIGINNAKLRTLFRLNGDIRNMLDSAEVLSLSTADNGGTLPNGMYVREQREFVTRQLLINHLNDADESFRSAGGIQISHCCNITINNLQFQGPGAIDVSGNDLLGMDHSTNVYINNCIFIDGMDGNLDITSQSDSITIADCYFGYSALSYDHMNSCLIGANDRIVADRGKLHVTYIRCTWGEGCRQRMPMVRYGTVVLDDCKWLCSTAHPAIDARKESKVTIINGFFGSGIATPFRGAESARWQWHNCTFSVPYQPKDNN